MATIMIAGISALTPIDLATTVHTTIQGAGSALGVPGSGTISGDIDDIQDQIDILVQTGSCSQADTDADADFSCITVGSDGILYIVVDVTTDGGTGLKIQLEGVDACINDITITIAESPFLCVLAITDGEEVTLVDADGGDNGVGTADTIKFGISADPT